MIRVCFEAKQCGSEIKSDLRRETSSREEAKIQFKLKGAEKNHFLILITIGPMASVQLE